MDIKHVKAIAAEVSAAIEQTIAGSIQRHVCQGGCIHRAEIWSPDVNV